MSQVRSIDEFRLRDLARCPLMLPDPDQNSEEMNILPVLQEALAAAAVGKWLPRGQIRQRLEDLNHAWCQAHPERLDYKSFPCEGLGYRRLFFIAARLDDLVHQYSVMQAMEPYSLQVGATTLTGKYAVLYTPGRQERMILYLRGATAEHQPIKPLKRFLPDIVGYCRLVDYATKHPGGKYSILNQHFGRKLQWRDHVDVEHARRCVESAVKVFEQGLIYPNPGYHCRNCVQPQCCNRRQDTLVSEPTRPKRSSKPRKKVLRWQQAMGTLHTAPLTFEELEKLVAARPKVDMFSNPPLSNTKLQQRLRELLGPPLPVSTDSALSQPDAPSAGRTTPDKSVLEQLVEDFE